MAIFRRQRTGRRREGMTPFRAGLIAIIVIALFTYFGFTRANPFANPFEFQAVFRNVDDLKQNSPVRIAGIDVGKVKKVEPLQDETGARVTLEIKDKGLPIHKDAVLQVRQRIFLEGNRFLDIKPGSPSAGVLEKGATIPFQQTSAGVAIGDVLTALQSDTREDLKTLLKEFSKGLEGKGARGFNESIRYWESAYKNSALANDATLGEEPTRDLQRVLRGQQKTFAALVEDEQALKDLVTNLNITGAAFAREDEALEASIPELRDTLRAAQPALASLNDALPSLRRFAVDALPGVRSSGPTLERALPFIRQARLLFRRSELRGAARVLRQEIPDLVRLNRTTIPVLVEGRALSACTNNVLVPFANSGIPFPEFPGAHNQPFKKQGPRGLVGLSGESRLADANQSWFHGQAVGPPTNPVTAHPSGNAIRPAPPTDGGKAVPEHRPDVPCENQEPPNLNSPSGPVAAFSSAKSSQRYDQAKLDKALAELRRNLPQVQRELKALQEQGPGAALKLRRQAEAKR
jgi:phospholipid/cholesterol/gamma-HCH transport system substrate-binding protein